MKGHIKERSPGRWAIVIDIPDPQTGKRRRKWHAFKGTKRQAQIECARLISELTGGLYQEPHKITLAQFLERWLETHKSQVSPKTFERYASLVNKNIIPALGGSKITKLRPEHIAAAYTKARATGRRDGKGGLSAQTVHHVHRILRQALEQAVTWELLVRNPADRVNPPKVERRPMSTYDVPQAIDVVEAMRGTTMFVPALLAVMCGMRRGEIVALRWRNVDLVGGNLAVVESAEQTKDGIRYRPPKSGKTRSIALSTSVVAELKSARLAQVEALLKLGAKLNDDSFVAAHADGSPLQPTFITHQWVKLVKKVEGLPRLRYHDLRHAHATHMLASGVHPKVASERLGHSRVGITLDLYSHVVPSMQADAAERVDAAFKAAIEGRIKPKR